MSHPGYAVSQCCVKCKTIVNPAYSTIAPLPCGRYVCLDCANRWKCACVVCADWGRDVFVLRAGFCRVCEAETLSIDQKVCSKCSSKEPREKTLEAASAWDLLWSLGSRILCGVSDPEIRQAALPIRNDHNWVDKSGMTGPTEYEEYEFKVPPSQNSKEIEKFEKKLLGLCKLSSETGSSEVPPDTSYPTLKPSEPFSLQALRGLKELPNMNDFKVRAPYAVNLTKLHYPEGAVPRSHPSFTKVYDQASESQEHDE